MNKVFNVTICSINSKYIHSSLAPYCLLAGIQKYSVENNTTCIVEGTINEKLIDVYNRIVATNPDILGLCCYIWNISFINELIPLIRNKFPNIKIILGGPEVSYNADEVLEKNNDIDFIISGEGELPFSKLTDAIISNSPIPNDLGICYKDMSGNIIKCEPYIADDDPPSPYTDEYFKMLNKRISYLETSRGCPYRCAFCLSGRCGNVRFFDLPQAKENIMKLAKSGSKTIKFIDRTFNANKKRAKEIFKFIIENYGKEIPEGVCFHFEIAGDILDNETIEILNSAPIGSIQLEIGMQSFNEKTLAYINRKTDTKKLCENIKRLTEKRNIHIHIDLIAGLPFEDLESMEKSFNIAYSLNANMLQFGFLKLLYGADMRIDTEKYPCEFNDFPPYEVTKTPYLSEYELQELHYLEDCLDRILNSGRFTFTLDYLVKSCNLEPYKLFLNLGKFLSEKNLKNPSLDLYTDLIFEYFSKVKEVDTKKLRDFMLLDRLATNSSGTIPQILRISDPELKRINLALDLNPTTKREKNTRRSIGILYSLNKIVYVDYIDKNPITGRYAIKEFDKNLLSLLKDKKANED